LAGTLDEKQTVAIAAYVERLKAELPDCVDLKAYLAMQRTVMGWCPLLDADGACSAYGGRPLSCRSLLSTKESHWCGVDFACLSSDEKHAYVESLDRSVAAIPLHYVASVQETGSELERRALALMEQTFGFSLYGNMPVLVHLVMEHTLADAVVSGRSATDNCTVAAGLNHPFLLTFSP
jgi:Fe-S-cluster containining protein